jgi:PKHD-type hydroxylase
MILHVPNVLTGEQVARCREVIRQSKWVDGRVTAGHQSTLVKHNLQLPEDSTETRELGDMIIAALERHPLFIAAALPSRVFPPIFNRYEAGMSLGTHLDNSVRQITGTPFRLRTDIAATLFLSQPDEYDGGELVIDERYVRRARRQVTRR